MLWEWNMGTIRIGNSYWTLCCVVLCCVVLCVAVGLLAVHLIRLVLSARGAASEFPFYEYLMYTIKFSIQFYLSREVG